MSRCKYGRLKHPVGGRRCKRRGKLKHGRRHRRGLSRRTSPWLGGIGIGVLLVGAAVIVPQLLG